MKLPDIATTALHAALLAHKGEVVDVLLGAGAALDRESPPHFGTALHTAAQMGDATLVRKLLDAGADPRLKRSTGTTPLAELQAVKRTIEECERLLVAAGG
jgi:ankyrin repeat protein